MKHCACIMYNISSHQRFLSFMKIEKLTSSGYANRINVKRYSQGHHKNELV